jgi:hypothetical protein
MNKKIYFITYNFAPWGRSGWGMNRTYLTKCLAELGYDEKIVTSKVNMQRLTLPEI